MDTRSKILTPAAAHALPHSLAVVTGYFDILLASHARDLECVRNRTRAQLLVIVLPLAGEVLNARARAELVAALRVVDYVVIADDPDPDRLVESLRPSELLRLETADAARARQLREHVRIRQAR